MLWTWIFTVLSATSSRRAISLLLRHGPGRPRSRALAGRELLLVGDRRRRARGRSLGPELGHQLADHAPASPIRPGRPCGWRSPARLLTMFFTRKPAAPLPQGFTQLAGLFRDGQDDHGRLRQLASQQLQVSRPDRLACSSRAARRRAGATGSAGRLPGHRPPRPPHRCRAVSAAAASRPNVEQAGWSSTIITFTVFTPSIIAITPPTLFLCVEFDGHGRHLSQVQPPRAGAPARASAPP